MPTNEDLQVRQAEAAESTAQPDIATREERAHVVSEIQTGISGSGGTFNIHLNNIATDTSIDIITIEFRTEFKGVATLYDSFSSAPTGGSSLQIENLLLDESGEQDPGSMEAAQDATFSADTVHLADIIASEGTGPNQAAMVRETAPIVEPGRQVVFEIENTSASSGRASISIVYREIDRVYSRES